MRLANLVSAYSQKTLLTQRESFRICKVIGLMVVYPKRADPQMLFDNTFRMAENSASQGCQAATDEKAGFGYFGGYGVGPRFGAGGGRENQYCLGQYSQTRNARSNRRWTEQKLHSTNQLRYTPYKTSQAC
mmetsp:Transcript_12495/g.17839  ORF Transcript_12495/g.17839 Transcript_12495/m.17839 type:complete len:131 (-) Transcript_12495:1529-1921(-)